MVSTRRIAILYSAITLAMQSNASFAASASASISKNNGDNNNSNQQKRAKKLKPYETFQVKTCAGDIKTKTTESSCIEASAKEAAFALNSHDFLRSLIANKNTKDEVYSSADNNESHSCEYTGTLWFGSQKGIRFRETMRILEAYEDNDNSSGDADRATVECLTRYHNGKSWKDCARVLCSLNRLQGSDALQVEVGSELLMDLWVPGVAGAACKKISRTFEDAAGMFFQSWRSAEQFVGSEL